MGSFVSAWCSNLFWGTLRSRLRPRRLQLALDGAVYAEPGVLASVPKPALDAPPQQLFTVRLRRTSQEMGEQVVHHLDMSLPEFEPSPQGHIARSTDSLALHAGERSHQDHFFSGVLRVSCIRSGAQDVVQNPHVLRTAFLLQPRCAGSPAIGGAAATALTCSPPLIRSSWNLGQEKRNFEFFNAQCSSSFLLFIQQESRV